MDEPDLPAARKTSIPAGVLQHLTPAQLRELADLEEARREGRLSEGHYRRAREKIIQAARDNSATSR